MRFIIKDFTHMSHIIHPTANQETKRSTSIIRNTKTNNQRSTMSKELDNRLKWDQDTTEGHLTKSMGNHGFFHCSKDSKGFKLGSRQGQKGSSDTDNHKLNTSPQGFHKGHQGLNSWHQWPATVGINDKIINIRSMTHVQFIKEYKLTSHFLSNN